MKPTAFDQSNSQLLGGPAEKYGTGNDVSDLPVFKGDNEVISCWRASWPERLAILVTGAAWLRVVGSNSPPVEVAGRSPFRFDPAWYRIAWRPFGKKAMTVFNRRAKGGDHAWGLSLLQAGQRHLLYVGHDAVSFLWIGKSK